MISDLYNHLQKIRYFERTRKIVEIDKIGSFNSCVAVPVRDSVSELARGLWLKTEYRLFPDGNFTNIYDLFWNPSRNRFVPEINSSNEPYYLSETIKFRGDTMAAINGGYYFLTDFTDRIPADLPYNFCMRSGVITGLPSYDNPLVYVKNGRLDARDTKARGNVLVGARKIAWVGARSSLRPHRGAATLYNSKCCDVVKKRDANNIQIGILDSINIYTERGSGLYDIVVNADGSGKLAVSAVNRGGGTHFFDGLFILQIAGDPAVEVGETVTVTDIDGIGLKGMTSGISIGKNVHDGFFLEPVRTDRRDARSVIARDVTGNFHFIVFDGSKYIPRFNGVSARDISYFFSRDRFDWAYFLDGGGSSRLIVRKNSRLRYLANEFAFKKLPNGDKLWDWKNARKIASSISLRIASNKE